ncbi:hypothetical protein ALC57_16323 [Trachymyrmex cornetzi]|uniref:Uncharacterized protein n=1 Tax=Trachymyrmex cornetzi TaxID=471704 RepID=A0A195DGE3_9HYME|nr:hypothetical protein ALC57_16323 [Trachymyrmex cornetzi]
MYVNHPGIPAASNHLSSGTFRLLVVQEQQRMNFKSNINLRSTAKLSEKVRCSRNEFERSNVGVTRSRLGEAIESATSKGTFNRRTMAGLKRKRIVMGERGIEKERDMEYGGLARVQGTAGKCLLPYERIEESSVPSAILQINLQYAEQARWAQWLGGCSQSRDVCRLHKLLFVTVVITLAWKRFYAIARLHQPN